ncbi:MAG: ABC-F family ATP-binding cassette domain-containing protein [Chloroflexota bacterium]|nr:ABC-F family ATP-binding cassette domain-containing protein [Chloroflexota bacterium]
MTVILTAENLTKSFADRTLFTDISFGLNDTDRIGLIGVNGSGKTTLLRLLAGVEPADSGRVTLGSKVRVAYLPQNPIFDPGQTVLDHIFASQTPAMRLLRDYESTIDRLEREPANEALLQQLHELNAEMERLNAWEAETNARTILSKLGIHEFDARLGDLSGGQRKRVAMARALIDRAELLILDEPTNHLDVEIVEWLEEYLARTPGALLLVTHDRYFLDRVTNRIFELDNKQLYTYDGNYESYLAAKAERERLREATALKRENLLRKEMAWLQRGARARSTKQKAHIQRIQTLQESIENASEPRDEVTIALGSRRLGKRAIEMRDLTKAWNGVPVIDSFTYTVEPGDRIGIVGPNGVGKSTLLNLVAGRVEPDQGSITVGETVHLAYYDQESRELPLDQRVIDYIQEGASLIRLADGSKVTASAILEWFLFPPEQHYSLISKLSGGERRRLYLLRTIMDWPNVLLLDEPTNDLDIQTLTVLEDYLDQFSGTVLAVSHDRYFLDRVADFILAFEGDGIIKEYPGNYSLYREMREKSQGDREEQTRRDIQPEHRPGLPDGEPRSLTWKEKRELEALEARMVELEQRLPEIDEEMSQVATDYVRLSKLQREREVMERELEVVMERWLELSEIREMSR